MSEDKKGEKQEIKNGCNQWKAVIKETHEI
jgi:hypothetical protein